MVNATAKFRQFEANQRKRPLSLGDKYRVLDGLWQEAVTLGAFTSDNLLEGVEQDIELARVLNSLTCTKNS